MVLGGRLELPRVAPQASETCVSTNSTSRAIKVLISWIVPICLSLGDLARGKNKISKSNGTSMILQANGAWDSLFHFRR